MVSLLPPLRRRPSPMRWWLLGWSALLVAAPLPWLLRGELDAARPWLLLLYPPLAWWCWRLLAAGWAGLDGWRARAALCARLTLIACACAALAEPRLVASRDDLALVYCLDRSDSMTPSAGEAVRRWMLKTVAAKPARDAAGLVSFARSAAVELPPRQAFPFEAFATRVDRGGTDLERALLTAADVLPEDRPGRIVLASDGAANAGDLERALARLTARGIAVDVLPVAYAHAAEAWLERLDLPRDVRPGETYDAGVLLAAISPGRGVLTLSEDGREVARRQVAWEAGKARFRLPLALRGPGTYDYIARLEPEPGCDGWRENNVALGRIDLAGEGAVLLLTDPGGKAEDWRALEAALTAASRRVERRAAWECPDDPLGFEAFDACILVNVPSEQLDAAQQRSLRDAVRELGLGLLMVGGGNSFGPGGWNRTPVEEALPVSMDITGRRVMPKGALAIVLHTCEFPEGNTWAKRITKQAIRVLSAEDEVGVVAYLYGNGGGGGDQWVFPLTRAGDYDNLAPLVEACEPGDMPSYQAALSLVGASLVASDAASKHCIIISDGDPSPPTPELIAQFQQAKISISTVSVFPHGGVESESFPAIARATGGRSYFPQDPARLPAIFTKEAKTLRRSQVQNLTFTPTVRWPSPAIKGLGDPPQLGGYVLTTPKSGALTALEGPDEREDDPVLISWRYGTGAAAAFTGDLGGNWGASWVTWERYAAFCEQLVLSVGRVRARGHLRIAVEPGVDAVEVAVDDLHPKPGQLTLAGRLVAPDGAELPLNLRAVAPGRWRGKATLAGSGRYRVGIAGAGGDADGQDRHERASAGFAVAYSPEYRRFRSDPQALERIARRTGGRLLTGDEDGKALFGVERVPRRSASPAAWLALALLACLLPLDLALRRVQLGWPWKKQAAPGTGLDRLLAAKRRAPPTTTVAPMQPLPEVEPTSTQPRPAEPTAIPPSAGSTAGRLLDAKRRRQNQDKDNP
jgi:uncharacterized membrane protein